MLIFIRIWCCGNKKHLVDFALKLFKIQRSVIFCRRKSESIINKCGFSGLVTRIHSSNLWNRDMRLIHNDQEVVLKIVHQCMWRCSRRKSCKMSGIIFNAAAESCFFQHLNVKIGSLCNTLCLQQLVLSLEILYTLFHFRFDIHTCLLNLFHRNNIV